LLKIVEDIPPHLIVIFATTNPEKVLQTIKSRCQLKLEAKKQSLNDMVARLMQISKMENLTVSEKALEIIAKKGDRVPRECINLLENVAKTYDREVTLETVKELLGDAGAELYVSFINAANTGLADIMSFIYNLRTKGTKYTDFVNGLMTFVLDAMYIKHGLNLDEYTAEYVKNVKGLFDVYESQDFDMLLQILETAHRQLSDDNDKKNEVTLVIAAMRIAKIELLANGLADAQEEAIAENKISMVEHSKMLKKTQETVSEQLKMAVNPAMIKENFDNVAVVAESIDLVPKIDVSELSKVNEEKTVTSQVPLSTNDEIEDFFNN